MVSSWRHKGTADGQSTRHTYIYTCICPHMLTHTHMHTCTYTHTFRYVHNMYTHTYIHVLIPPSLSLGSRPPLLYDVWFSTYLWSATGSKLKSPLITGGYSLKPRDRNFFLLKGNKHVHVNITNLLILFFVDACMNRFNISTNGQFPEVWL